MLFTFKDFRESYPEIKGEQEKGCKDACVGVIVVLPDYKRALTSLQF